jgi:hypothetical protein
MEKEVLWQIQQPTLEKCSWLSSRSYLARRILCNARDFRDACTRNGDG